MREVNFIEGAARQTIETGGVSLSASEVFGEAKKQLSLNISVWQSRLVNQ